jgi:O-antigen ligase
MSADTLPARLGKRQRALFAVLMLAAALMPAVPDAPDLPTVMFALAFVAFVAAALAPSLFRPLGLRPWNPGVALAAFFVAVALSLPIALVNGVHASAWFRGAVPFFFLAIYFAFPRHLSAGDARFVLGVVQLAFFVWLAKMALYTFADFFAGDVGRLTYLHRDYQLPFAMIGFILCLFPVPGQRRWQRLVLGALHLFVVIACGYRSQAGLVAAALALFVWRLPSRWKLVTVAAAALALAVAAARLADSPFAQQYLGRFEDMGSEVTVVSRRLERAYGLDKFAESPLFGNGLAYPVPFSLQQDIPGAELERPANGEDWVGYLHNLWVYLLMDLGLFGLVAYVGFLGGALLVAWRRGGVAEVGWGPAVALTTLLLYFSVEAAFRLVQNNVLLGVLAALLVKTEGHLRRQTRHLAAASPAPVTP